MLYVDTHQGQREEGDGVPGQVASNEMEAVFWISINAKLPWDAEARSEGNQRGCLAVSSGRPVLLAHPMGSDPPRQQEASKPKPSAQNSQTYFSGGIRYMGIDVCGQVHPVSRG